MPKPKGSNMKRRFVRDDKEFVADGVSVGTDGNIAGYNYQIEERKPGAIESFFDILIRGFVIGLLLSAFMACGGGYF